MSITRTGLCRHGLAGTWSTCRTGFTPAQWVPRLALELVLVWMLFLPRRWRIICFFIVTPWQIGVILTANYTFLNYLVLVMGVLLLDDEFLRSILPARWKGRVTQGRDSNAAWRPSWTVVAIDFAIRGDF